MISQAIGPVIADTLRNLGVSSSPAQEELGVNDSTVNETNSSSTGRNDGFQPGIQREQSGDIEIPDEINNNFLPRVVPGSQAPAPGVLTENQTLLFSSGGQTYICATKAALACNGASQKARADLAG